MRRAKATASAAAARTPGRKLLASLSMGVDMPSDRDADYRGGPGAPFSPHLFVGVEEDWHEHTNTLRSDDGGANANACSGSDDQIATPTVSLSTGTSTANDSGGSARTPETDNDKVRSKSLAVGSATPVKTCARRSTPCASTGLSRYFTPREYDDTTPRP